MRLSIEKILVIVFLVLAAVLWWPLLKWHRVFESSPAVVFKVPAYPGEALVAAHNDGLLVPSLQVVELAHLNATELKTLQQAGLAVFKNRQTWQIGPYLRTKEAEAVAAQVTHDLKIPVTIVNYRVSGVNEK